MKFRPSKINMQFSLKLLFFISGLVKWTRLPWTKYQLYQKAVNILPSTSKTWIYLVTGCHTTDWYCIEDSSDTPGGLYFSCINIQLFSSKLVVFMFPTLGTVSFSEIRSISTANSSFVIPISAVFYFISGV